MLPLKDNLSIFKNRFKEMFENDIAKTWNKLTYRCSSCLLGYGPVIKRTVELILLNDWRGRRNQW